MERVKITQKALLLMAKNLKAIDISTTEINTEESSQFDCIAISVGLYGINGAIFENKGKYYFIKGRTANLFRLL